MSFEVRNSDIDLNHHVNNVKYAQWILDALPIEILRTGANLVGYEVNFLAEAKIGDQIKIQIGAEEIAAGVTRNRFQGVRAADGRAVFSALLLSTEVKHA